MRSVLLFVGYLAILPVSLIHLALKDLIQRIHLNQIVHSLYPRLRVPMGPVTLTTLALPLLNKLLCPIPLFITTSDAACKHINLAASCGSWSVTPDGCVRFANRYPTLQIPGNVPDEITLELCLASCNDGGYPWGGVRKKQCCACFTWLFDEHSFLH